MSRSNVVTESVLPCDCLFEDVTLGRLANLKTLRTVEGKLYEIKLSTQAEAGSGSVSW